MLSSLILDKDTYRGCFSRIYIWSPSIKVDDSWGPVKDYIKNELGHDEQKEGPFCFEEFNGADMRRIAKKQQKCVNTIARTLLQKLVFFELFGYVFELVYEVFSKLFWHRFWHRFFIAFLADFAPKMGGCLI